MDRRPARRRLRLPGGGARHGRVGLRPGQARRPVHREGPEPRRRHRRGAAANHPRRPERRGVPAAHHARAARRVARLEDRAAGATSRFRQPFASASSRRSTRPSGGATYPASSLRSCAKRPSMPRSSSWSRTGRASPTSLARSSGSSRARSGRKPRRARRRPRGRGGRPRPRPRGTSRSRRARSGCRASRARRRRSCPVASRSPVRRDAPLTVACAICCSTDQ